MVLLVQMAQPYKEGRHGADKSINPHTLLPGSATHIWWDMLCSSTYLNIFGVEEVSMNILHDHKSLNIHSKAGVF